MMPAFISSNAPLAKKDDDGDSFASGSVVAGLADTVVGSVFADQAGTLFIEQSYDGTNWDISTTIAVTASAGTGFSEPIYLPLVRVRFANTAATAQTAFRVWARASSAGPR